ncbi:unnamed protein product, partial [Symbiodinium natans]
MSLCCSSLVLAPLAKCTAKLIANTASRNDPVASGFAFQVFKTASRGAAFAVKIQRKQRVSLWAAEE